MSDKDLKSHEDRAAVLREAWQLMRPVVHFSIAAMGLIARALIGIVRMLPALKPGPPHQKALKKPSA